MLGIETLSWHTVLPGRLSADSIVVDLGANRGAFARAAIDRFGCFCFAVEAVPELSASIGAHPRLRVFNRAICDRGGPVLIHVCDQEDASSLLPIDPGRVLRRVEVEGSDLASLVKDWGVGQIDLLKVDIEGSEIAMFDSLPDEFLERVRQISVEFHDFCGLVRAEDIARVRRRLRDLGFACFKFSRRDHSNVLFVNRSSAHLSRSEELYVRFAVRAALRAWWPAKRWLRFGASGG
jgi:FkbM family methyltransferase